MSDRNLRITVGNDEGYRFSWVDKDYGQETGYFMIPFSPSSSAYGYIEYFMQSDMVSSPFIENEVTEIWIEEE